VCFTLRARYRALSLCSGSSAPIRRRREWLGFAADRPPIPASAVAIGNTVPAGSIRVTGVSGSLGGDRCRTAFRGASTFRCLCSFAGFCRLIPGSEWTGRPALCCSRNSPSPRPGPALPPEGRLVAGAEPITSIVVALTGMVSRMRSPRWSRQPAASATACGRGR
jgi:hypothetical protein